VRPVSPPSVRILSDLHYGEEASQLRSLEQLAPLLDGPAAVLLNGDSIETRFLATRGRNNPAGALDAFRAFLAARAGHVLVLTGNHDPDLSDRHHADLADGRLLVTHGDTLFPELAPWGWEAALHRAEQTWRLAALPEAARFDWETRLHVCKAANLAVARRAPRHVTSGEHPLLRQRLRALLRLHRILRAWREAPDRAAELVRTYRPRARAIVLGHTHRPGVWWRGGVAIINTGAFMPPFAPRCVDVVGDHLHVRRIVVRDGAFHAGPLVREIPLA
jgi:predicted phosphodiesterase